MLRKNRLQPSSPERIIDQPAIGGTIRRPASASQAADPRHLPKPGVDTLARELYALVRQAEVGTDIGGLLLKGEDQPRRMRNPECSSTGDPDRPAVAPRVSRVSPMGRGKNA